MVIETPQPNGTLKTQTKTFYDPVPVPADEIEENGSVRKTTTSKKNTDKTVALSNPNTTMVVRKIPNGREEVYTTVNADGTKSIQIKTFYDAQEEEITEETQVEVEEPGETRILTKQRNPKQQKQVQEINQRQVQEINQKQVVQQQQTVQKTEQHSTQEVKIKRFQETKQFSQTTEISGKSITTKNEESLHALTDQTEKKKKKKKGAPPPPIEDKPGQKTTVVEKKIAGGTEYHYTTVLEDGRTVTSVKTVYEEEEVDMTEDEIKKYKKQLREAEKHKNITEATPIPSKSGTKQIVPSENPGDVTTVETKKIKGGVEYHYTTVTAEGIVKKSSKTVYDPVPVEGSDEEEEIIEEYEEEIIEPGETITETIKSTKTLSSIEHHEETIQKKKGKKVKK